MDDFLHKEETYQLIGAAFEVYNALTCAYNEPLYQEAYQRELTLQSIPFIAQPQLKVKYKGEFLKKDFFADIIAFDKIIVELKALPKLTPREESQLPKSSQSKSRPPR